MVGSGREQTILDEELTSWCRHCLILCLFTKDNNNQSIGYAKYIYSRVVTAMYMTMYRLLFHCSENSTHPHPELLSRSREGG